MTLTKYIVGYLFSLCATALAFGIVELHIAHHHRWPTHAQLLPTIVALALLQFIVQMICFLHLSFKKEERLRLLAFGFAAIVVGILTSGSLWIMFSLNGRMMPNASQMEMYMQDQNGI
jgi:cytochrome o ubiquinol oxidase operon protein cyoD